MLGYDRDGHLAVMEHKVGIEWVTGHRLESGHTVTHKTESMFGTFGLFIE